uniref:Uncharacterized protein n=1 Tax=Onchocerca volvulus TaxID=6282 RepID=A0A8R1TKS9_ONCVO
MIAENPDQHNNVKNDFILNISFESNTQSCVNDCVFISEQRHFFDFHRLTLIPFDTGESTSRILFNLAIPFYTECSEWTDILRKELNDKMMRCIDFGNWHEQTDIFFTLLAAI